MNPAAHSLGGRRRLRALLVIGAVCGFMSGARAGPASLDEHSAESVKAAFILRFAGYVTWPEELLPQGGFTIAVLGARELVPSLQALQSGRSLLNRPVQVHAITSAREAADAQVLFVGRAHRGDLRTLLAPLAGRSVLIITDEDAGLLAGGTINLLLADQRVRFEISLAAARRARLKISSDLLGLAVRVLE